MTSNARHRYSSAASSISTYSPSRRKVSSMAESTTACWPYNPEHMSRDSFTEDGNYELIDDGDTNSLSSYDVLNVYKYSLDGASPASRNVSIVGAKESITNVPPPVFEEGEEEEGEEEEEEHPARTCSKSMSFDTKWAPKLSVSPSTREMKMKDFNML